MIQNNINIDNRIRFLLYRINNNLATIEEKNEYLDLLLQGGYINKTDYDKNKKELTNKGNSTNLGEAIIGIGIAVLVGTLLSKLFDKE
ncbi:hypothetical protein [Psychroserpens burtonensis]|uniref:hypothetical protein n=1 Tax=Psychroserpens burtonensis TaxID=49278 RepID=UPI000417351F|nr:hypothetical protein [Psychroserpens burtonensis]